MMKRLSFPRELLIRLYNVDAVVPSIFLLVVLEPYYIGQMILHYFCLLPSSVSILSENHLGVFYLYVKTRSDAASLNYLYSTASIYTYIQTFFLLTRDDPPSFLCKFPHYPISQKSQLIHHEPRVPGSRLW